MNTPQAGIFAFGAASHTYLELDSRSGDVLALVRAVARLDAPRTTGGVNVVTGFRPELLRRVAPGETPASIAGFNEAIVGVDGFAMPATQHDVVLWVSGSSHDIVFDVCRSAISELAAVALVASEVSGWPYHHDRDLTGFIDGTENPSRSEAAGAALVPQDEAGAGGSVFLIQRWVHDATAWESLPVAEQERAMGRRKSDSVELDDRAPDAHIARTDQEDFGEIFRRNMPYGTVSDHGTMFVGFSGEQQRLTRMLEQMAGAHDGVRDALTRYIRPVTGGYYFVPSDKSTARFRDP